MMELLFVFWFSMIWWKLGSILDVLKDIRKDLKGGEDDG